MVDPWEKNGTNGRQVESLERRTSRRACPLYSRIVKGKKIFGEVCRWNLAVASRVAKAAARDVA
jgi:hypothetical protein